MRGISPPAPPSAERLLLEDLQNAPVTAEMFTAAADLGERSASLALEEQVLLASVWSRIAAVAQSNLWRVEAAAVTVTEDDLGDGLWRPEHARLSREGELELGLRLTPRQLDNDLHVAETLTDLPIFADSLAAGRTTGRHARVFAEAVRWLSSEDRRTIDAQVAHRSLALTSPAFRQVVMAAVAALEVDPAGARRKRVKDDSGAQLSLGLDGVAHLDLTLANLDGRALLGAINQDAHRLRTTGDQRTIGERQITAVLAAFGIQHLDDPASSSMTASEPTSSSDRPHRCPAGAPEITVTIDLWSLLGLQANPGHVPGFGAVAAEDVTTLLRRDGATLRRLVYDPMTGNVVDYSTDRYPTDRHLAAYATARDVTCRFPGCTRSGELCDIEHCTAHDDGGPSSMANCCLTCRRHHRMKTLTGHSYTRPDPTTGETVWTTPLGFTYQRDPTTWASDGPDPGDTERIDPPPWPWPADSEPDDPRDDPPPF